MATKPDTPTGESECCGIVCTTRFCPRCGRQLHKHDLFSLRRHCIASHSAVVRMASDCQKRCAERAAADPDNQWQCAYDAKLMALRQATVDKWATWIRCLDAVLDDEEPSGRVNDGDER